MPFDRAKAVANILRSCAARRSNGPITREVTRRYCVRCHAAIEYIELGVVIQRAVSAETCSYDCPLSGLHPRPEGSTIVKRLRVTEELISEEVV